jgi:hypothetical protein
LSRNHTIGSLMRAQKQALWEVSEPKVRHEEFDVSKMDLEGVMPNTNDPWFCQAVSGPVICLGRYIVCVSDINNMRLNVRSPNWYHSSCAKATGGQVRLLPPAHCCRVA